MIVARDALGLGDALELYRALQHHALRQLIGVGAENFLPRRLAFRNLVAARRCQSSARRLAISASGDQHVAGALVEIDPHLVAVLQDGKAAAGGGFRRGIEDRGRARGAGLAAVAHAGERADALFQKVVGARMLTTSAAPG